LQGPGSKKALRDHTAAPTAAYGRLAQTSRVRDPSFRCAAVPTPKSVCVYRPPDVRGPLSGRSGLRHYPTGSCACSS
jgi:hypothetical protein